MMGGAEFGIIALLLMFLPTLIALLRGHDNTFAIFLTNLLLGWTVIGYAHHGMPDAGIVQR